MKLGKTSLISKPAPVYPGAIHLLQRSNIVAVTCSFVCAVGSYYLIEMPMIRIGRRFVVARQPALAREQHQPT
jgi:peptidoglycan/LPS O-acetylase OafA/YrhL